MPRLKIPVIDPDHAVRAALAMIDEHGLAKFSLEGLARRLGVRAPSLYHHFRDRSAVLESVARTILADIPIPPSGHPSGWQERLVSTCVEVRRAILAHPRASPLLVEFLPRRVLLEAWNAHARMLRNAGVPDDLHTLIFEGLEDMTLGAALFNTSSPSGFPPEIDANRFPELSRSVAGGALGREELFARACQVFLDGITLRME